MGVISYDDYFKKKKKKDEEDRLPIRNNDGVINIVDLAELSDIDIKEIDSIVKENTKEEEKRTWFSSGSFDDGYQIGDVSKTILGTAGDVGLNVVKGVANVGEGIGDLFSYGVAGIADKLGYDDYAELTRKEASRNMIEEWSKPADDFLDKYSVVGEKSDSISQGIGNVLAMVATGGVASGIGKAGSVLSKAAPTIATTGLSFTSGTGSGMSEAYRGGATDGEAVKYGLISGLADAGTELIFGGLGKSINAVGLSKGLSSVDDALATKVGSMFKHQLSKNLAEYTIKAGAEGTEEVLAGFIQGVGKYLTYQTKEDGYNFWDIIEDENLLEQFIVGAVTSGIAQTPGLVRNTVDVNTDSKGKKKISMKKDSEMRDFVTGYTQNEQKVIDKEVETRVKEAQKDGKKLNNKEISKIQEEVKEDLSKGYISLDTIESTLGGETYNKYKSLTDKKTSLESEIKALENKKLTETTVKDNERLQELRKQLSELDTDSIKSQLSTEVDNLTQKDYFLRNSYNEDTRRKTLYAVKDTEKSDNENVTSWQQSFVEAKSNDSTKAHEFSEFGAKIIQDKNIKMRAVNYETLVKEKKMRKVTDENGNVSYEMKVNGEYKPVQVNGFKENGVLNVNIQSKKAFETTVGHELGEFIKDSDATMYDELKKIAIEVGKVDGTYSEDKVKQYADLYGENTDDAVDEYVNDKLGELFTNDNFVDQLSTKPSLIKKIISEIKHLVDLATAGSQEKRKLISLQHKLENKFKEAYKNTDLTKEQSGVKQRDVQTINDTTETVAKGDIKQESVVQGLEGYSVDEVKQLSKDYIQQKLQENDLYDVTIKDVAIHGSRGRGTARIDSDLDVVVEYEGDIREDDLFNILNEDPMFIEDIQVDINPITESLTDYMARSNAYDQEVLSKQEDIAPIKENKLTIEQEEYFKDSVVRDENGNLKVMYHGTSKGGFTVFDIFSSKFGLFGQGSYFTDNKSVAESYTEKGKGKNKQVYEVYLNITNPIDMDVQGDAKAWADALRPYADDIDTWLPESGTNEDYYKATLEYFEGDIFDKYEIAEIVMETIQKMGYDGITHEGGGRFGAKDGPKHRVYIALESNQIKNIDNTNPTKNDDIRYSLSEAPTTDNQGRELSKGMQNYMKNSKARDEDGSLLVLYHGGTATNEFTHGNGEHGEGFYFTPEYEYAETFAEGDDSTITEVYLKLDNPLEKLHDTNKKELSKFIDYISGTYNIPKVEVEKMMSDTDWSALIGEQVALKEGHTYQEVADWLGWDVEDVDPDDTGMKAYLSAYAWQEVLNQKARELGYDGIISRIYNDYAEQDEYIVFNSNQIKSVDNTNPTDSSDIRYSLSEAGLKEIADEFGGGKNYWEVNLYDKDLNGAIYYLKHQDSVKEKFKKLNNIKIEPVYKDVELKGVGTKDANVQNFIKDNNLNVVDLANNQELLDKFYELEHEAIKKQFNIDDAEADEIFNQWKDYFERQKGFNDTIWPLLRFENDFKNIIEGNTKEIDNIETAKLERQLVDDNSEFEKYVTKYAEKLFGEKVEYDVDEVMEEAKYQHGTTDNFEVGAYMTTDGSLLNFNDGGYRNDHRTISVYGLNMKEFMDYGAIRMQPETPGFEMQVEPTSEQYNKLYDYIDYIKSTRESDDAISIDIDKGKSYDSATYTMNTPTSKIISDVKTYWKTGQFPKQSEFADFRYSLSEAPTTDNKGRTLTIEQQDFFKDSKVRDDEGNLVTAYHGTTEEINIFDKNRLGSNTGAASASQGFFFTSSKEVSEAYSMYARPKYLQELEKKYQELEKVAQRVRTKEAWNDYYRAYEEYEDAELDYANGGRENYENQKEVYLNITNPLVHDFDGLEYRDESYYDLIKQAKENGNDGVILKNTYDGYGDHDSWFNPRTDIYVVFESNQIKNVDNTNPTLDDDIRHSLSNQNDIAPVKNPKLTYAEDVKLQESLLPITQEVETNSLVEADSNIDIAPVKNELGYIPQDPTKESTYEDEDLVKKTKKELRKGLLIDKNDFFINALDNAKNRSMALMNNTDTIRNTELVFGRENAKVINDLIFQKEIDNEADSIAWQNQERQEIKDLGIKARSKESAAVQKYGEKQYINDNGEVVAYTDKDLANEFKDIETQEKIKNAAKVIRQKYDNYIDVANNVLTKLGFDPIKKRNDYMRHFQELNDVFSRYGIPFNAQNMQEHTLPTDINGLTEFWSPQKNYFANMQPRKGMKTNYDAITGIDGYIGGIANLIYHTEDIQRGRAFEELIRETYGEDKGWDNLEQLPEELQQARAEKIQDNHLSNYAAWVHEWTNNIAGKKNKIDRSIEAMFGRKVFTVLDETRKQVGSNMIGLNLSSSLTNLIAPVQAAAKTNKLAVVKGTADTIKNMFVKDDFMNKNKFLTARMGTDMISKNAWQKMQDAGFIFMKGMDWFSSNQIVRSKYYELRAKGLSEAEAHSQAGQFAARILGDRTKGANAQLYNSKLVGLVTQFQLEVNNQLYSMFYDTYHESKENAKNSAMRTAAGMTFTLGQLFAFTHLFGQTFESIAGYNPTFDVVEMLKTALGWDDEEDEETTSERLKKAADMLVDALPYVNILTGGGRIPVASGIPNLVAVATGGKDQYGNEVTLEDELKKLLYLIPPTGGNQFKKTTQGLGMFDEDLPVSGSYTDSGNLRFPVEDTPLNRVQAAIFGQYANENAGNYFDNERQPLKEKQIQEYKDLDIPIADYWEYREGLSGLKTNEEKIEYISGLDFTDEQKNIMVNNATNTKYTNKEGYIIYKDKNNKNYYYDEENHILYDSSDDVVDISKLYELTKYEGKDISNYDNFGSYEEFNYSMKNPQKYKLITQIDSYNNYKTYEETIEDIKKQYRADDSMTSKQKTALSKQRKSAVQKYINSLSLDVPQKLMLQKAAGGYSIKDYEKYMYGYINSLEMTAAEKQELHNQLFD